MAGPTLRQVKSAPNQDKKREVVKELTVLETNSKESIYNMVFSDLQIKNTSNESE
jgi:hypothetical protein